MEEKETEIGQSEAERTVDALNRIFGKQGRNRAIHAKGIVLQGSFTPSPLARQLSAAPHLQGAITPVTVRFSCFSGNPNVADNDPMASPRGLAVKFHLAEGDSDIVAHSFNGFPASSAVEFRQLLEALATGGAQRFMGEHPRAREFFEAPKPPPVSYGTLRYFGVNAFKFTNARGETSFGRYRLEPVAGEQLLSKADAEKADPDYLRRELPKRLPVSFKLLVQLASPGDRVDDPTMAWPNSRPLIDLGTLEIDELSRKSEEALVFAPGALPTGIAPADPMIPARDAAYDVSFKRRR